jgi:hypothetical protein
VARWVAVVAGAGEKVAECAFLHGREVELRAEAVDGDLREGRLPACRCRS